MIKQSLFGDTLRVMERHVDFAALAASVDHAAPRRSHKRGVRPLFPTERMVRVLLIQQLFNLSDEQMEFQLLDCPSFHRFVGMRTSSQIPDRMTVWAFKERLIKVGASETVVEAVNCQLSRYGYMARGRQMLDACIVQTPKQSIKKEEKTIVAEKAMPAEWSPAKRRQKDVEAPWAKRHGKSYLGYKLSASADKRYRLIRKIKISTSSERDTLHFEAVIDPSSTSRDIYPDKGYVNGEREARLKSQGWRMHIQRKGNQGKPLSEAQERRNRRIASPRASVEHVFAGLAQLGGKTLRSIGLARARLYLNWKAVNYNLRRFAYIKEAGIVAF